MRKIFLSNFVCFSENPNFTVAQNFENNKPCIRFLCRPIESLWDIQSGDPHTLDITSGIYFIKCQNFSALLYTVVISYNSEKLDGLSFIFAAYILCCWREVEDLSYLVWWNSGGNCLIFLWEIFWTMTKSKTLRFLFLSSM